MLITYYHQEVPTYLHMKEFTSEGSIQVGWARKKKLLDGGWLNLMVSQKLAKRGMVKFTVSHRIFQAKL